MAQEGIFILNQSREPNAGIFQLPQEADKEKFSFQWVKRGGSVDAAKQPQPILGTNMGAEGWSVFLYPKDHKLANRPAEVPTSKDTYILMQRPKSVQADVNAIYGNISKQHLVHQQTGDIIRDPVTGGNNADPGMLTDARIRQATGITEFGGETLQIPMNPVRVNPKVEAEPAARVSTEV
jgi:hypothetical protein